MRLLAVTGVEVAEAGSGGQKRMWHLIDGFNKHGISTTILTIDPNLALDVARPVPGALPAETIPGRPRRSALDKLVALVSPLPEAVWSRPPPRRAELRDHDLVMFMGPSGTRLLPRVKQAGLPSVLDMHDVVDRALARIADTLPGRVARWRTRTDSLKWRRYQRRVVREVSMVVAVSDDDADAFRRLGAQRATTHTNGVDLERYRYADHTLNRASRLLMTGSFGYQPNIDAARWLSREVHPRLRRLNPNATLQLVGRDLSAGPWPTGVLADADVPDVRGYFDAADVFVVPLRAGGGTRLKILEAFAKGLPTISTAIGCEGLPVEHGVHLLVADTTEDLVAAILRLLGDSELRARLAGNARELVERRYGWDRIAEAYADDLHGLAKAPRR